MKTLANFTALVKLCIQSAEEKYGKLGTIDIRYDLKGRSAGQAGGRRNRITGENHFYLRFNREAIEKHWDEQVNQTIPHEVAHLVAFAHPRLGAKNHNYVWQRIDRSLGGTGERCHNMELTPAKRRTVTRYLYITERGTECPVGPKHHKHIQMYGAAGGVRIKRTGEVLDRSDFKRTVTK